MLLQFHKHKTNRKWKQIPLTQSCCQYEEKMLILSNVLCWDYALSAIDTGFVQFILFTGWGRGCDTGLLSGCMFCHNANGPQGYCDSYPPIRGQGCHLWANERIAECHHWHPNPTFPGPPLIPLASLVQFTVLRKFDLFIFKMSTLFLAFFLMQSQN